MSPQFFVGIGAQRTGTTWLANYFSNHPQVFFSPIKELHFFDSIYRSDLCNVYNKNHFTTHLQSIEAYMTAHGSTQKGLLQYNCLSYRIKMIDNHEKYREYFSSMLTHDHNAFGEITPSYSLLEKDGFNAILNLYPDAKFILILRNPSERYWSHLNLHESRFPDFKATEQVFKCIDNPQYFLRTDYKKTLTTLLEVVPENKILVLFFEHLFNPLTIKQELTKITNFLCIDFILPDSKPLNESKKNPLPVQYRKRIFQHFQFVYQFICQNYPEQIPQSWLDDLRTFER
jgi:hypothetical protein